MTMKVRIDGVLRTISNGYVRVGGQRKRLTAIKARSGGSLRTIVQFADPLSVNITPTTISGAVIGSGTQPVTTDAATATPTGGLGPFTYAWTVIAGAPITINNSTSASTTATKSVGPGDSETGTLQVTVTDAIGQTATDTIDAFFNNFNFS